MRPRCQLQISYHGATMRPKSATGKGVSATTVVSLSATSPPTMVPPNPSAQTTPVPARYGPAILPHLSCTLVRPPIPSWPKAAMRPPCFHQTPPRRSRKSQPDTVRPSSRTSLAPWSDRQSQAGPKLQCGHHGSTKPLRADDARSTQIQSTLASRPSLVPRLDHPPQAGPNL